MEGREEARGGKENAERTKEAKGRGVNGLSIREELEKYDFVSPPPSLKLVMYVHRLPRSVNVSSPQPCPLPLLGHTVAVKVRLVYFLFI